MKSFRSLRCGMLGCVVAALTFAVPSGAQTAGQQEPRIFEKQLTKTLSARYLLYLPKDYGKEASVKWPLLLFLHGSGESGTDIERVKVHGPPKLIAAGKEFSFIVVSPQSPGGGRKPQVLGGPLDSILT